MSKRSEMAEKVLKVGQAVNELREALLAANYVFMAGAIRAAEEAVLFVHTMIDGSEMKESDL